MVPLHSQEDLRNLERELRRDAEDRRRRRAALDGDGRAEMDAEIRTLIEREGPHVACPGCADALAREAG
jgi:hypothetical protein